MIGLKNTISIFQFNYNIGLIQHIHYYKKGKDININQSTFYFIF